MTAAACLLAALGCGGVLYEAERTVIEDAGEHLRATYGERFVVMRAFNGSHEGVGIIDRHRWVAHPLGRPGLRITGYANYEVDPPLFTDDYRCLQVLPLVEAAWREALAEQGLWPRSERMVCDNEALPVHPKAGERWDGAFSYRDELGAVWSDASPEAQLVRVEAALQRATDASGVTAQPYGVRFYDPALAAFVGSLGERTYIESYQRLWMHEVRQTVFETLQIPAEEAALASQLPAAPGPVEVRVVTVDAAARDAVRQRPDARVDDLPEGAKVLVDLRLAVGASVSLADVEAFVARAREVVDARQLVVHVGRWEDPEHPRVGGYLGGWRCQRFPERCVEVSDLLVPPMGAIAPVGGFR